MDKTVTTNCNSSGEDYLLNQLNSFELNEPLKVDVIFEDSDEEQELPKIKIEKNISSKTQKVSNMNENNIDISTKIDKISISNALNKEDESRKRKPEDKCLGTPKKFKIDNYDERNKVEQQFKNNNISIQNPSSANATNNKEIFNKTNTHMAAYVCNLLKAVSRHLILILDSYYKYIDTKASNNPELTDKAYENFYRVKCHFFNLSFCTVANIILPEIQNQSFISNFLEETLNTASEKKITINLHSELEPLFNELVNWTRKKKEVTDDTRLHQTTNNFQAQNENTLLMQQRPQPEAFTHTDDNQKNGNTLLKQQLQQPPLLNNTKIIPSKDFIDNVNNPQNQSIVTNRTAMPTHRQKGISNSSCTETQPQYQHKSLDSLSNYVNEMFDITRRQQSKFEFPPNAEQFQFQNNNTNIQLPVNNVYNNHVSAQANTIPSKQGTKPLDTNSPKSVLFSSGPPGRRLSISVDPTLVPASNVVDTKNEIINQTQVPLQYQSSSLQQPQPYQTPQMLQHTKSSFVFNPNLQNGSHFVSHPENNANNMPLGQRQPKISSQHQIQMFQQQQQQKLFHQYQQQKIQQHYNYQQQMLQQIPLSNMQSSSNFSAYPSNNITSTEQSFQTPAAATFNAQKANPRQLRIPSNQQCFQPPATVALNTQKPAPQKLPPPYPIETFSFETEYQSFLEPNLTQKEMKEARLNQEEAQAEHRNQTPQLESPNAEITRSGSTDSGFMSPLNFSSNETVCLQNKDRTQEYEGCTPVITHITSLNPGASYIAESNCSICGNVTRKMCLGCYNKYYCSSQCQRSDWHSHMAACKQQST